jgi:hypothetical protein
MQTEIDYLTVVSKLGELFESLPLKSGTSADSALFLYTPMKVGKTKGPRVRDVPRLMSQPKDIEKFTTLFAAYSRAWALEIVRVRKEQSEMDLVNMPVMRLREQPRITNEGSFFRMNFTFNIKIEESEDLAAVTPFDFPVARLELRRFFKMIFGAMRAASTFDKDYDPENLNFYMMFSHTMVNDTAKMHLNVVSDDAFMRGSGGAERVLTELQKAYTSDPKSFSFYNGLINLCDQGSISILKQIPLPYTSNSEGGIFIPLTSSVIVYTKSENAEIRDSTSGMELLKTSFIRIDTSQGTPFKIEPYPQISNSGMRYKSIVDNEDSMVDNRPDSHYKDITTYDLLFLMFISVRRKPPVVHHDTIKHLDIFEHVVMNSGYIPRDRNYTADLYNIRFLISNIEPRRLRLPPPPQRTYITPSLGPDRSGARSSKEHIEYETFAKNIVMLGKIVHVIKTHSNHAEVSSYSKAVDRLATYIDEIGEKFPTFKDLQIDYDTLKEYCNEVYMNSSIDIQGSSYHVSMRTLWFYAQRDNCRRFGTALGQYIFDRLQELDSPKQNSAALGEIFAHYLALTYYGYTNSTGRDISLYKHTPKGTVLIDSPLDEITSCFSETVVPYQDIGCLLDLLDRYKKKLEKCVSKIPPAKITIVADIIKQLQDDAYRTKLAKAIIRSISSIIQLSKIKLFNRDPTITAVENGVLNILPWKPRKDHQFIFFRQPEIEDFVTRRMNVSYNPDAGSDDIRDVIGTYFDKITDNPAIDCLFKHFSDMLRGKNNKKLLILHGPPGGGKSTLVNGFFVIFGINDSTGYSTPLAGIALCTPEKSTGNANSALAKLAEARLCFIDEISANINTEVTKQIVGGVTAMNTSRKLYKDNSTECISANLVICTNSVLRFSTWDKAIISRIRGIRICDNRLHKQNQSGAVGHYASSPDNIFGGRTSKVLLLLMDYFNNRNYNLNDIFPETYKYIQDIGDTYPHIRFSMYHMVPDPTPGAFVTIDDAFSSYRTACGGELKTATDFAAIVSGYMSVATTRKMLRKDPVTAKLYVATGADMLIGAEDKEIWEGFRLLKGQEQLEYEHYTKHATPTTNSKGAVPAVTAYYEKDLPDEPLPEEVDDEFDACDDLPDDRDSDNSSEDSPCTDQEAESDDDDEIEHDDVETESNTSELLDYIDLAIPVAESGSMTH